jgi:uncharacterized RDD family membrane protein YckC
MDWYYSDGGRQFGPVTHAELDELVASGRIGGRTLIWQTGMETWLPLFAALPIASPPRANADTGPSSDQCEDLSRCSECGNPIRSADLLDVREMCVCASCKDIAIQRLREGVTVASERHDQRHRYAGFWIRFVAWLIDGFIVGAMTSALEWAFKRALGPVPDPEAVAGRLFLLSGIVFALELVIALQYASWFVAEKGATPGKLLLSLEVICVNGDRPSYERALARYLATWLSAVPLFLGYIMAGFDDEKRALHDRICDTRVIRR